MPTFSSKRTDCLKVNPILFDKDFVRNGYGPVLVNETWREVCWRLLEKFFLYLKRATRSPHISPKNKKAGSSKSHGQPAHNQEETSLGMKLTSEWQNKDRDGKNWFSDGKTGPQDQANLKPSLVLRNILMRDNTFTYYFTQLELAICSLQPKLPEIFVYLLPKTKLF